MSRAGYEKFMITLVTLTDAEAQEAPDCAPNDLEVVAVPMTVEEVHQKRQHDHDRQRIQQPHQNSIQQKSKSDVKHVRSIEKFEGNQIVPPEVGLSAHRLQISAKP